MSEEMKNHYGDNVSWFCYEGAVSLENLREEDFDIPDSFEVLGCDDDGNEGTCEIGVIPLLESAHIKLTEQEERIKQLESAISQTIGFVESTNGEGENIRLLHEVMNGN